MAFGKKLEAMLEKKGISQSDLARQTGISKTTLSSMLSRDVSKVDIEMFLAICRALGCQPDEFYQSQNIAPISNSPPELKADERHLLELYRQLSPKEQGNLIGRAELLAEQHREAEREDAG
jgi:DNA-binding Xre family transcriptional regulator